MKSYLTTTGYFRYALPHAAPAEKELLYFPYWRFKGMVFWCLPEGIQNRFVDVSHQAVPAEAFPISLGLRSQALRLRFVTMETLGKFIAPTLTLKASMNLLNIRFDAGHAHRAIYRVGIGDTTSLIYAPFYLEDKLFDAVLNEPIATPKGFDVSALIGKHPAGNYHFIPALCPQCGLDLVGHPESLAIACYNCRTIWQAKGRKFEKITVSFLPWQGDNAVYLPFWRINAAVSGIALDSYADLARLANLPAVVKARWETLPFYFWGPAFKVLPQTYLRLLTNTTLAQPLDALSRGMPEGTIYPVGAPLSQTLDSLMVALAGLIKPHRTFTENLNRIHVAPQSYCLAYLPFQETHYEFVQPRMNLAVNKNQLAMAKNL
ncbi:MAG: hypothetical protein RBT11_02840 [Desulfobacterales bacterium]|nr:hypothetical protein [Desulfobacterales bacterium]